MRLLKILLIIASVSLIGMVLYLLFYEVLGRPASDTPIVAYVYLSMAFITSTINIVYHIVSFQFYKRKENVHLDKKIPKILWIGGICFSSFLLYIGGAGLYSLFRFIQFGLEAKQLVFVSAFLIGALLGFLELSLLKKRIKKLRMKREMKDEINDIGSSIV